jgi:hypothetical protein
LIAVRADDTPAGSTTQTSAVLSDAETKDVDAAVKLLVAAGFPDRQIEAERKPGVRYAERPGPARGAVPMQTSNAQRRTANLDEVV